MSEAWVTVVPVPLTAEAYARYGSVLEAGAATAGKPANQGTARRHDFLAEVTNLRPGVARLNAAVFRCQPRSVWPMPLSLLERHAASAQVFVPMNAGRYLVLVCGGGDAPDPSTLGAFVASGRQGVSYHPGVWHHPMIALDGETDFACFVWEDGTDGDCEVRAPPFAGAWQIVAP